MPNRDNSVIEHIKGYCEEIEKELKEIDNDNLLCLKISNFYLILV